METQSSPKRILLDLDGEIARLLVLASPNPEHIGRSHVLLADRPLQVGREATSESGVVLHDAELSRVHAVFRLCASTKAWEVRDLGSRNGTFLNARRIDAHELVDGDVLRVGRHILLYQRLDASACRFLLNGSTRSCGRIVGRSHPMLQLLDDMQTAAATNLPVLVLGESGTGKELVAEALHAAWGGKVFVPINCAALPEQLIESELFGHARGAFTGATSARRGLFDAANGGTLFLDEIGELPLPLQAKLLRVVATGEVRSLGDEHARKVAVRIVAATNRDLEHAVAEGHFRSDLLARLATSPLRLPALRKRKDDIPKLIAHLFDDVRMSVDVDALEALLAYSWPWNVRELEQTLSMAKSKARSANVITVQCLPDFLRRPFDVRGSVRSPAPAWNDLLSIARDRTPTCEELCCVLDYCQGNISRVAAFFGRERRQIYRWAEHWSLDLAEMRTAASEPRTDHIDDA